MMNFIGYALFGKLFRESSGNVTVPIKRNVCMTLMKRVNTHWRWLINNPDVQDTKNPKLEYETTEKKCFLGPA